MSTWTATRDAAIEASKKVLIGSWPVVAAGASHQIDLLIKTAQYIEEHRAAMTESDYLFLIDNQKVAMRNVLMGYEGIGAALAQNATAAAVNVIVNALPALLMA